MKKTTPFLAVIQAKLICALLILEGDEIIFESEDLQNYRKKLANFI